MLRIVFPLLLAGTFTLPAAAQIGAIEGPGTQPCSKLVEVRSQDATGYVAFGAWLSGYLAAANVYEENTYDLTPWQPLEVSLAQVVKYCEANPDKPVINGISAYIQYLRARRIVEKSDLVEARNGDKVMPIYVEMIDRIRKMLTENGYLDAGGSGFDEAVVAALVRYQRDQGLSRTGLPDIRTMLKMFP